MGAVLRAARRTGETALFEASGPALWQRLTLLLPIAVVGVVAGHALAHRVPTDALRRVICALLVASGAMLMLNAIDRMV